ncbi:uncharacterized protein E0L32_005996 [Thyridium curvatum]|uniref:Uncharacterized protein n=1 Tax=Thyridium curvatum TaxID=1093900 RepID=A0A507ARU9_9PEZI|nr:uncharacterized protein E0L32_005996 [Thyridium curvatum]TPX13525.1 hypothetical protein E0L32_005996 [Thyridium curvatum]
MAAPAPNAECPCGTPYFDKIMPHVKEAHVAGETVFCPVARCEWTGGRHRDVVDHLVRVHYYYQPSDPNKGTSKKSHLKRLEKLVLLDLIEEEYLKLESQKDNAREFEEQIAAVDPTFVSQHGLSTVAGEPLEERELKTRTDKWLANKLGDIRDLSRKWTEAMDWLKDEAGRRGIEE